MGDGDEGVKHGIGAGRPGHGAVAMATGAGAAASRSGWRGVGEVVSVGG